MANKKELYWIAPGVVGIGGREYGADDVLPVDDISKTVLARWKKAGKIGEKITASANGVSDARIAELEATVSGLTDKLTEADERKAEHAETRGNKLAELAEANISLTAKIGELVTKVVALPADGKKLKAGVDALKAEINGGK